MNKFLLAVSALVFSTLLVQGEEPVSWTRDFVFSELPSQLNPAWKEHGDSSKIENGVLVIDPAGREYAGWYFNGGSDNKGQWDGSRPSTIEFRMCTTKAAGAGGGASLTISDGQKSYRFSFGNSDMRTYRVTLENGLATIYRIDSSDAPTVREGKDNQGARSGNIGPNAVTFGKMYANVDGISEWAYIRWTNEGAFRP